MILNSSSDPVLVKKIDLRIWTLRDEIESTISEKIEEKDDQEAALTEVISEYTAKEEAPKMEAAPPPQEGDAPVAETAPPKEAESPFSVIQKIPVIAREKLGVGVSLLAEINMDAIYFFATRPFIPGQSVMIEFRVPNHFIISADIIFCRSFNLKSRIISAQKMPYRIGAKFSFVKKGERTLLRKFVSSIEPSGKKSPEVAKEGGGETDADLNALLST